jgi:hypothetical protein
MRRSATVALLAALSAACSSTPSAAPPTTSTAPTTTNTVATSTPSSTTSAPTTSVRGLLAKSLGQSAGFSSPNGADQATFTLDAITVDAPCTGPYAEPAEQGHMIVLAFTITTAPTLLADQGWYIHAHDFALVGPDGVTSINLDTNASRLCLTDAERLPLDPYAAGSKYVGKIALDAKHATGTITYRPQNMGNGGGWEWAIPAA